MIKNRKEFIMGVILAVSFFLVLGAIYSPVFNGKNGLEFADSLFNSIAKGSTYYIPEVQKNVGRYQGEKFDVTIKLESAGDAQKSAVLFEKAGASTLVNGSEVKISGDLGSVMTVVLNDADMMFKNEGDVLTEKYGYYKKDAMYHWWLGLQELDSALKKQGSFSQAAFVHEVAQKAVEPAYNFFGIKAESVSDFAGTITGMLVFYIIYTIWWGFAIFFLFEGLGFSMSKGAKKAEA